MGLSSLSHSLTRVRFGLGGGGDPSSGDGLTWPRNHGLTVPVDLLKQHSQLLATFAIDRQKMPDAAS